MPKTTYHGEISFSMASTTCHEKKGSDLPFTVPEVLRFYLATSGQREHETCSYPQAVCETWTLQQETVIEQTCEVVSTAVVNVPPQEIRRCKP